MSLRKDIAPGADGSFPDYAAQPPVSLGRAFFFVANDGTTGLELWKSDGVEDGPMLVKDVFPGAGGAKPSSLTVLGDTLFFVADDGAHGSELWKTDGTPEGTSLVKDIRSGPDGAAISSLTVLGKTLFFVANDGATGAELWMSDGTEAGTRLVKDLTPGGQGSELGSLAAMNGLLYFSADGGPHDVELWKSNGTEAGTERVAIVRVIGGDPGDQTIRNMTAVGSTLYFFAGSSYGKQWDLWKSDGTSPGTSRIKLLSLGDKDFVSAPDSLTPSGGLVFFQAGEGGSLWRSDGTEVGTFVVRDSSDARWLTALDGKIFFTSWDHASGYELWKSDGTIAGTAMVADIHTGHSDSAPQWLKVVDGRLLFTAETPEHGREIWGTDGTGEGTKLLYDVVPGTGSSEPSWFLPSGPRVFFVANDGATGLEPWLMNDCTPPTVVCPAPMTAEAKGPMGSLIRYAPAVATDNRPTAPVLQYSQSSESTFPLGNTEVTAIATDEAGNTARCSFTVNVQDTVRPRLTCPSGQEASATGWQGAMVEYTQVSASDDVSMPTVTYHPPPGTPLGLGRNEITVLAVDAAGNKSSCTFDVTVARERSSGCGCGAGSSSGFSAGILMALAVLFSRRKTPVRVRK